MVMALNITAVNANKVSVRVTGAGSDGFTLYRTTEDLRSGFPGNLSELGTALCTGNKTGSFTDTTTEASTAYYYYAVSGNLSDSDTVTTGTTGAIGDPESAPTTIMGSLSVAEQVNVQNRSGKVTKTLSVCAGMYTLLLVKTASALTDAQICTAFPNADYAIISQGSVTEYTGYHSDITVTAHVKHTLN